MACRCQTKRPQFARCLPRRRTPHGPLAKSKESKAAASVTWLSANIACHHHSIPNHIQLFTALLAMFLVFFEVLDYLHHFHIVSRLASRIRGFKTGQKYYYKSVCAAGFIFPQKIKKKRRKNKIKSSRHEP
jgi:hypothetical protein